MAEQRMIPEVFTAVDLEMTGLNVREDRILEIAAVRFEGGEVTARYECLIDPECRIPETITELTGITEQMVRGKPKIAGILPELYGFLGDTVLVGHNLMFDYSFLKKAFVNHGLTFERNGIDTLKLMRTLLPDLPSKTLDASAEALGIACPNHHRATADAETSGEILIGLAERLNRGEFPDADPEIFTPKQLIHRVKKEQPASKRQLEKLEAMWREHGITPDADPASMTKNEVSRRIDRLIALYGRKDR